MAQLLYLANDDPDKDITLYINSPGGSVSAGMAIYDAIQVRSGRVAGRHGSRQAAAAAAAPPLNACVVAFARRLTINLERLVFAWYGVYGLRTVRFVSVGMAIYDAAQVGLGQQADRQADRQHRHHRQILSVNCFLLFCVSLGVLTTFLLLSCARVSTVSPPLLRVSGLVDNFCCSCSWWCLTVITGDHSK